jgi:gamma-glutamylcyclotransferase (GGCT)/AIG2-like uncharacterized protein YtfP
LNKAEQLVFVYGTLRTGEENHALLTGSVNLGMATTAGKFTMLDMGDYPAVINHGNHAIVGEVYMVSRETMAKLDVLEEYPDYYQRMMISTPYGDAWIYVLEKSPDQKPNEVKSGDWIEHKIRR